MCVVCEIFANLRHLTPEISRFYYNPEKSEIKDLRN